MPDRQAQVAQLMVGGIDLISSVQPDSAKDLKTNPALRVTALPALSIFYIALDSVNKSGTKAISDPRVRLAIHKAIDRDKLIKHLVPGGEVATKLEPCASRKRPLPANLR